MTDNAQTRMIHNLKQVKHRYYPYLERLALDWGIRPGNDSYTRFIVLGRSRVGSNFLRGLLNSHPEVAVFGELFQNPEIFDWAYPGHRTTKRILKMRKEQPVQFLEHQVFHRFPRRVQAVGFKIFYYHAQSNNWKPVWTYLKDHKDIRVIHIKRRNILETHISRKRAALSDVWVKNRNENRTRENGIFRLDYDECLEDFTQTRAWEREYDHFFAGHPHLEVVYEDLAADYSNLMERIQEFLNVSVQPVQPRTYKQSRHRSSDDITNYAEMQERFRGTEWETFFDED